MNGHHCRGIVFALAAAMLAVIGAADAQEAVPQPAELYRQHCAACHGADRLGGTGPALLPESLERLKKADALKTIAAGRAATQMPAFAEILAPSSVEALAAWIYTPVVSAPKWDDAQIRASRVEHFSGLPNQPASIFAGRDMMNLFLVVESGDHHLSVLDGDRFEVIARIPTRFALHGGPKFTQDGRFVYLASRDGWISKFDLWNLKVVAEVRAGINTRNVAVSSDGKFVAVANYLPQNVVLFDANLQLLKSLPARTLDGTQSSRVSAIYDAGPRHSFVAAMKDMPEVWEISYDPKAPLIFDGYVHDYRMGEAVAKPGFLNVRRTPLALPLEDFYFDPGYAYVMGASRDGKAQVINLDVRRKVADLAIDGMPHLGSGISFDWQGRRVMASPNLKDGMIDVIDMSNWERIKTIPTPGPGFFMRSHENTPYAWTDSMMSRNARNRLTIIDKASLTPVAEVAEPEGRTLAHIEFTRDGRYALASVWERKADGGAIVIYDAATFKEIRRLPMDKPVGKYNLYNKINRSEGTSH